MGGGRWQNALGFSAFPHQLDHPARPEHSNLGRESASREKENQIDEYVLGNSRPAELPGSSTCYREGERIADTRARPMLNSNNAILLHADIGEMSRDLGWAWTCESLATVFGSFALRMRQVARLLDCPSIRGTRLEGSKEDCPAASRCRMGDGIFLRAVIRLQIRLNFQHCGTCIPETGATGLPTART